MVGCKGEECGELRMNGKLPLRVEGDFEAVINGRFYVHSYRGRQLEIWDAEGKAGMQIDERAISWNPLGDKDRAYIQKKLFSDDVLHVEVSDIKFEFLRYNIVFLQNKFFVSLG